MQHSPRAIGRLVRRAAKFIMVAGLAGAAVYWYACAPLKLELVPVRTSDIVAEALGTGTLDAHVKATLSPKISGLINKVLVDQGDLVRAGQTLVRLDDAELKRQEETAVAEIAVAQAALDRLRAEKARAVAVLSQAERYQLRLQEASQTHAVAHTDLDKAQEAVDVAKAELSRAEAAIVHGERQLVSAERLLEYHRARLADAEIRSPFDGLVIRRDRHPGDIVVPGSSIAAVISLSTLWVSAWVDETEMRSIKPGQPARVVFRSEPDRAYPGTVARLGREADREAREFVVDVRIEERPANWAIGQRAEVFIETARKQDVPVLSARQIVRQDGRPGVYVVREGRLAWQALKLGLRSRDAVEILEGLEPGAMTVVPPKPPATLTIGRMVEPE